MSKALATTAGKANSGTAKSCGDVRSGVRAIDRVITAAQRLWPRKTAAELSVRSGTGVRACEYWLSRTCDMSAEALAELIRSEEGLEILAAIMGEARPTWWKDFARAIEIGKLRRAQAEHARRLERLERLELDL